MSYNDDTVDEMAVDSTASEAWTGGEPDLKLSAMELKKCPACGDNLRFDAKTGMLKCQSCGSTQAIRVQRGVELGINNLAFVNSPWVGETHAYHCANCNARDVLNQREIARTCPFCGSPSVVEDTEFSAAKPNAVLPFCIDAKSASESAKRWAKKQFFAPNDFQKKFREEEMRGVYLPVFTFDTMTTSTYSGELGEYYYVTVKVNGQSKREQRTRYFSVSGSYDMPFNDIPVSATSVVPNKYMSALLCYDYENSVEYNDDFLLGYSALLYETEGTVCWNIARDSTQGAIRSGILSQYDHDTVSYLNVHTNFYNSAYRYVLVPMYVGNYNYRGKEYNFYVNGRTGLVKGKAPISPWKVFFTVLGILVAVAAIGVGIYFLQQYL